LKDTYDNEDCDDDGDTFNPIDQGLIQIPAWEKLRAKEMIAAMDRRI